MLHMKRREFIALLSGAAEAWPLAARGQRSTHSRAGLLWVASERVVKPYEESMRAGFRDLGYIEGRNFFLDARYADGDALRLPALIDDRIALKADALLGNNQGAALMKTKTATIPIGLNGSYDPVEIALVHVRAPADVVATRLH